MAGRDDRIAATVDELATSSSSLAKGPISRQCPTRRSWIDSEHADADHLLMLLGSSFPRHTIEDYDRYLSINSSSETNARQVGAAAAPFAPTAASPTPGAS